MFRIGQKVVCVDIGPTEGLSFNAVPELKEGRVYIIRWEGLCPFAPWRRYGPHVRLEGIVRGVEKNPDWNDFPFRASRFRPIVERKTDISVFVEILRRESMPDECAPAAVYGVDWGASA